MHFFQKSIGADSKSLALSCEAFDRGDLFTSSGLCLLCALRGRRALQLLSATSSSSCASGISSARCLILVCPCEEYNADGQQGEHCYVEDDVAGSRKRSGMSASPNVVGSAGAEPPAGMTFKNRVFMREVYPNRRLS